MQGIKRLHLAIAGAGLAVVAALAVFSVSALAASPSPTSTPKSGSAARSAACSSFRDNFAKAINKSAADVDKAFATALTQTLAGQVKAGNLTQAQADAIKQKSASQTLCGPGLIGGKHDGTGRPGFPGGPGFGKLQDVIAQALGVTAEELHADFAKGMTVHQIADSKNITQAQFNASLAAAEKAKIAAAVTAGTLTQAQADAILQHQPADMGNRLWDSSGRGFRGVSPAAGATPSGSQ